MSEKEPSAAAFEAADRLVQFEQGRRWGKRHKASSVWFDANLWYESKDVEEVTRIHTLVREDLARELDAFAAAAVQAERARIVAELATESARIATEVNEDFNQKLDMTAAYDRAVAIVKGGES